MEPLVSIIIPTYNRCHLLGETLDSIISQIYTNWECIVVDDGSTDYTNELMCFYCGKDRRIQFYHRPEIRPKGANACRNFGFELSKGKFVNWFDSDDLMTTNNLEEKINAFEDEIDFVIGNTVNFDKNGELSRVFKLDYEVPITPENVIGGKIGWITNDVMLRRSCILIRFNERLESGQEYNFFSRLLYHTNRGKFLRKDLAKRRLHDSSIQGILKRDEKLKNQCLFENEFFLLQDIEKRASEKVVNRSLRRIIRFSYFMTRDFTIRREQKTVIVLLKKHNRYKNLFFYLCWISCNFLTGKGYFLLRKAHRI
ncbi:MAG: glycosyltransferase family 2 protein [Fulvivirga sp.]